MEDKKNNCISICSTLITLKFNVLKVNCGIISISSISSVRYRLCFVLWEHYFFYVWSLFIDLGIFRGKVQIFNITYEDSVVPNETTLMEK